MDGYVELEELNKGESSLPSEERKDYNNVTSIDAK